MDVGRTSLQRELPEWSLYFVNLRGLRQILKTSARILPTTRERRSSVYTSDEDERSDSDSDDGDAPVASPGAWVVSGYLARLETEIAKVRSFYDHKHVWVVAHEAKLMSFVDSLTVAPESPRQAPGTASDTNEAGARVGIDASETGVDRGDFGATSAGDAAPPAAAAAAAATPAATSAGAGARGGGESDRGQGARRERLSAWSEGLTVHTFLHKAHHSLEDEEAFMSPSLQTALAHDDAVDESRKRYRFLVVKKALKDFRRELYALKDYLKYNHSCVSHALKFLEKRTHASFREQFLRKHRASLEFMNAVAVKHALAQTEDMLSRVKRVAPRRSELYYRTKVYTVGCFDLFHRGHVNLFKALREYGHFIVAGIHDDQSYFDLKHKHPVHKLAQRMKNVRPHVDMLFVIPHTDPTMFLQAMVSPQDVTAHQTCYVRGEDMESFPGREWVETVMPVHFLPRSMGVSSTLVRSLYQGDPNHIHGSDDRDSPWSPSPFDPATARAVSPKHRHRDEPSKLVRTSSEVDARRLKRPVSPSWRSGSHNAAQRIAGASSSLTSPQPRKPLLGHGMSRSTSTPNAAALVQSVKRATATTPGDSQRKEPPESPPRMHSLRPAGVSDLAPLLRQLSDATDTPNSPVSQLGVTEADLATQRARMHGRLRRVGSPALPPRGHSAGGATRTGPPSALDREAALIATMVEAGRASNRGPSNPRTRDRSGGADGMTGSDGAGAGTRRAWVVRSDGSATQAPGQRGADRESRPVRHSDTDDDVGAGGGTSPIRVPRRGARGDRVRRGSGGSAGSNKDTNDGLRSAGAGASRSPRSRRADQERRRLADRRVSGLGQPAAGCARPHPHKRHLQQPPQRQRARGVRGV